MRVNDLVLPRQIVAGSDVTLNIVLKATVVTVTLNGQVLGSFAFNSPLGDGQQGVFGLGAGAVASVDEYRVKTDDSVYAGAPPLQTASISDMSVVEGAAGTSRIVTMTVTRSSGDGTLSIPWTTGPAATGASATFGVDVTGSTSGVVTFAAGQTTATITFTVWGDAVPEPNESFVVTLQPSSGVNLKRARGVVTILTDDGSP